MNDFEHRDGEAATAAVMPGHESENQLRDDFAPPAAPAMPDDEAVPSPAEEAAADRVAETPSNDAATDGDSTGDAGGLEPVIVQTTPPPPPSSTPEESREKPPRTTRIIAMMNQKGGVGKTTTAVNLGAGLARRGYSVLLIDLDPQAHLTLHLGIDAGELDASMYDLLTDDDTTAISIVHEVADNLGVLPAEVNLAGVEQELADKLVTGTAQSILRRKVGELASHFDYVLIDCPPSLGLLTINALTMAKEVIVPMQAHFLALQGLSKLLETVRMVRQGINPRLVVAGVVLCMHESNTLLAGEVVSDLKKFFEAGRGEDVPWKHAVLYQPPIRRNIKLAEAPSFGQAVFDYASECNGAQDYYRLAKSVAAHPVPIPA